MGDGLLPDPRETPDTVRPQGMRAGLPPGPRGTHNCTEPHRATGWELGSPHTPTGAPNPSDPTLTPLQTAEAPSQAGIPGAADCCHSHPRTAPAGGRVFVSPSLLATGRGSLCPPHQLPALGSSQAPRVPPLAAGRGSWLTWGVVAQPDAAGAADAQVGHGGGQVGGAAAPAQGRVRGLLGVQGGGQGGREVQRGQVGQGPPRVEGRGHEGHVGRLIRGWEYAGGEGRDRIRAGAGLPPPAAPAQCPPVPPTLLQPLPSTHWIPGTSQERGRAEEDESCGIKERE